MSEGAAEQPRGAKPSIADVLAAPKLGLTTAEQVAYTAKLVKQGFTTVEDLKMATIDNLVLLYGLKGRDATALWNYLHPADPIELLAAAQAPTKPGAWYFAHPRLNDKPPKTVNLARLQASFAPLVDEIKRNMPDFFP